MTRRSCVSSSRVMCRAYLAIADASRERRFPLRTQPKQKSGMLQERCSLLQGQKNQDAKLYVRGLFFIPASAKNCSFSTACCLRLRLPFPPLFNVGEIVLQVRPRRKGTFFRRQHDPPIFTPATLKRRGKGCKSSGHLVSLGTFFRRHRYIENGC